MEPGRTRLLDELAGLIGGKSFPNIDKPDWYSIEAALKCKIPADYKLFAEAFPAGQFEYLLVHTPDLYFEEVGFVRRLRETAEDVQDFIESFYEMPFHFYPEIGGFVPWANIDLSTYIGWVDHQGKDQIATLNLSGDWDIFTGGTLEYPTGLAGWTWIGRLSTSVLSSR